MGGAGATSLDELDRQIEAAIQTGTVVGGGTPQPAAEAAPADGTGAGAGAGKRRRPAPSLPMDFELDADPAVYCDARPAAGHDEEFPSAAQPPIPTGGKGKKRQKKAAPAAAEQPAAPAATPMPPPVDAAAERRNLYEVMSRYEEAFPGATKMPDGISEHSSMDCMKLAYAKMQRDVCTAGELATLRSGLGAACGIAEGVAASVPGEPLKLQGFRANVDASIAQFDHVLKQLSFKYFGSMNKALTPEVALVMAVGNVMLQTHAINRMFGAPGANAVKPEHEM